MAEVQNNQQLKDEIKKLAQQKDAVILAHYYVSDDIQDIADYVGDSYALAKIAKNESHKTIVFCGVTFMGESACILNPDKTVLVPNEQSVCPMALMADPQKIKEMREQYEDLAVVCYINSTAQIKALSDVIVTSSNAINIVKNLPNKNIYFIPDGNLGRFVKEQVKDKNVILNNGYCHVHTSITLDAISKCMDEHPESVVIAHPECIKEVCDEADYLGSTKELIEYVKASDKNEFIVCTESGVLHQMKKVAPGKTFHFVGAKKECPNMKRITLQNIKDCLINNGPKAYVSDELRLSACKPLDKMLQMAK